MERARRGVRRWRVLLGLAALALTVIILVGWQAARSAYVPSATSCPSDPHRSHIPWERAEQVIALPEREVLLSLCLGYITQFDAYGVLVPEVSTRTEYEAAKVAAAARLRATGFDPCDVLFWPNNSKELDLTFWDWYQSPVSCPPRLIAMDTRVAAWLPAIRAGVDRVVAESTALTGVEPTERLTIVLASSAESAILGYERYVLPGYRGDVQAERKASYERLAAANLSTYYAHSVLGKMLLVRLNFDRYLRWDAAPDSVQVATDRVIAHEYMHFIQDVALSPGFIPPWYGEGQANLVEALIGLRGGFDYLVAAADERRNGKTRSLRNLNRRPASSPDGQINDDVYTQGHAIVAYLVDQHGFDATMELLRTNRHGDDQSFNHQLGTLTGLNIDELDAAVGDWLLAPGRVLFRDDYSRRSRYNPRQWDQRLRKEYVEGEYAVTKFAHSGQSAMATVVAPFGDFQAMVEARFVAPIAGATLDLEVTLPGSPSAYTYRVDPMAHAFVLERKMRDSPSETVIDWTPVTAIRGDEAPQRFGVHTRDGAITLLANGEVIGRLAGEVDDSAPSMGSLVIRVGHRADGHAEVRFRSLVVANAE